MTASPRAARAATSLIFFVNGAGLGLWAGHIPLVKQGLGLDDASLGVALLAMALGAVFAMPVVGSLTVRLGSRRCLQWSGLVYGLALGLPLLAPSYAGLLGVALLLGAANGSMDVAMNTQASTVERAYGQPIMSAFHAFFSLGGVAGSLLAGALLGLGSPPTLHMLALGIVIAALVQLAGHRLMRTAEGAGSGFALPTRAALGIGVLAMLTLLSEGAIMDWSAVYLATSASALPATAALGYAAFSIAMTTGRLTGDAVVRRLGRSRALVASGIIAAVGLVVGMAGGTVWLGIIGFGISGLGLANAVPILFSTAASLPGTAPGVGVAMVATLGYAGFLLGPPVIGLVADVSGLRLALLLIVPGLLAVSLLGPRLVAATKAATTPA